MYDFVPRKITYQQKIKWIRVARTKSLTKSLVFRLLSLFKNIDNVLENIESYSIKGGLKKPIKVFSQTEAEKEFEDSSRINSVILTIEENEYPFLLRQISDPPLVLTAKGNLSLLNSNIVSVVGPRNPSYNGYNFAKKIASELGENNLIVASGLAKGVDTAAHLGSINTGTIAVIAGGIDHIYPKENHGLYHKITENGLIISENKVKSFPKGGHFPQRNRIISGISLGVVVVEATLRSGTLITARYALEQNREVFSVPGFPLDPRCQGTNRLIKNGAKLIGDVQDILEELDLIYKNNKHFFLKEDLELDFIDMKPKFPDDSDIDKARNTILNNLNYSAVDSNKLISSLGIPINLANISLIQLELADKICNINNRIFLKHKVED